MVENSEVLNTQAIDLASQGHFTEAIECFKRAIKFDKTNFLLWYNLGVTYRDSGDLQASMQALEAAYKIDANDEDLLETMASVCFSLDEIDEAFTYCSKSLEINQKNPRTWNMVGVLYFAQTEYGPASTAFETAVTLHPYYYDALFNLKDTYEELGNTVGQEICEERLSSLKSGGYNA